MKTSWAGKRVLITGVCGTVGNELLRRLMELGPAEITGIDNNEAEVLSAGEEFHGNPLVRLYFVDVRDFSRLKHLTEGMDVILHAAALKRVILNEHTPSHAMSANIEGMLSVIDAAFANNVERVVFASSNKAANPASVLGVSKLMGERLMTAANAMNRDGGTVFNSMRFGTILGLRGSVIPLLKQQISDGGPVTLADPEMTRFVITLTEAVEMALDSVFLGRGGEVFVKKMKTARIMDLAEVMIETLAPKFGLRPGDVKLTVTGVKPGEKLYEELINKEETGRAVELEKYFAILPALKPAYRGTDANYPGAISAPGIARPYNSSTENPMTKAELADYVAKHNLLSVEN